MTVNYVRERPWLWQELGAEIQKKKSAIEMTMTRYKDGTERLSKELKKIETEHDQRVRSIRHGVPGVAYGLNDLLAESGRRQTDVV